MAAAQNLKEQINAMAEPYLAKRGYAALAIGIYQRGNKFVQGFGKFSGTNGNPPDAQTLFGIGSITKVFTAIVLARMVEDGLVRLEDPLSLHLPQGVASPPENGREITLKDLATHTFGLPRMPENFNAARAKSRLNPEAHYTTKDLYDSLAMVKLSSEPGKNASYSNYGYALLGKILELRSGKSYEQLIQEYVCKPLGLQNTTTQLSTQQKERLTPGHGPQGHIIPN
jgi:serine-type D-Ala-D-Ala carboxypeptidase/endopeptidase